jgi:hypothetical protein
MLQFLAEDLKAQKKEVRLEKSAAVADSIPSAA